jgi:hypothetical protein
MKRKRTEQPNKDVQKPETELDERIYVQIETLGS